ncbi:MAG: molybdopterin-dependent oxidoreductase [Chloracidobacterium sp.]|nr:molybdopterin-dependent oxidoreductase [Chloracidobacterium sp.]
MKNILNALLVAAFLAAAASVGVGQVTVAGLDGKETKVEKAQIAKLTRVTLKVSDHGKPATFDGVVLADVLKLAGIEFGEALRGKRLTEYLVAEAADGYKAVYSLTELDDSFTDKKVILADRRDGKDLPENARNYQIVVEGDKRAGRWVRSVIKLRIVKTDR